MNARQLEVFRAIMRDGSVTAAANSLAVSQPAVSKVLHHLECQLGYKLFERIGGRLVPTSEAHLIYDDVDRVFREIEALKDMTRTIRERKLGSLRIGASPPVTYSILPQALLRFRETFPEVKIHLSALPKREISEQLLIGEIDLAVTLSRIQAPTVRSEVLSAVPIVAVMREDGPLAQKAVITPNDLKGHALISYNCNAEISPALDEAFSRSGADRDITIHIGSSLGAIPLVHNGLGIALVDGLVDWQSYRGLVVRPFEPAVMMSLCLSINTARPVSRLYNPFASAMRTLIKERLTAPADRDAFSPATPWREPA